VPASGTAITVGEAELHFFAHPDFEALAQGAPATENEALDRDPLLQPAAATAGLAHRDRSQCATAAARGQGCSMPPSDAAPGANQ